ncbi:YppF family protein [Heyndrickxia acidicola]|uniref:YppF family protein n=1 Tax=Heyndrickxia acidicola TaxID=209389 RepID=A0ABU6MEZ4_9BACI|nr:YppF family protein [Heyndrickxia acidicola]MED1203247.1 YppF family protein [Heyndrickxia acidicola]
MTLENLIFRYITCRQAVPSHVNALLDYTKKEYIAGNLSIIQYRRLLNELDKRGATPPFDAAME